VSKSHTAAPSAAKIEGTDNSYPSPLTKEELARHMRVGLRTVDNWIASRKIPYIKLGRLVRFRLDDVERALKRYTVEEVTLSWTIRDLAGHPATKTPGVNRALAKVIGLSGLNHSRRLMATKISKTGEMRPLASGIRTRPRTGIRLT
jgi:excisionase family DNA binding protein